MTASVNKKSFLNPIKAVYYTTVVNEDMLKQEGCVKIYIYTVSDADNKLTNLLVSGDDSNDEKVYCNGLTSRHLYSSNNLLKL